MKKDKAVKVAEQLRILHFPYTPPLRAADGIGNAHLAWMVREMPNLSENKTMRWLGYIQGYLVSRGSCTLEQMKELNKPEEVK